MRGTCNECCQLAERNGPCGCGVVEGLGWEEALVQGWEGIGTDSVARAER